MKIQYMLSNGAWVPASPLQLDTMFARILERETWFAPRQHREPMTTWQQVLQYLATGKELHHDDDWYAVLRLEPAPLPEIQKRLVRCDCGHTCASTLVMSASLGSACPECYDRMSD